MSTGWLGEPWPTLAAELTRFPRPVPLATSAKSGMTQAAVSTVFGVSANAVSRWVNGLTAKETRR